MIPNINLLPKNSNRTTESNIVYIIIGVLAVLVLAFMVWQYVGSRNDLTTLATEEVALQQEVKRLQVEYETLASNVQQGSMEESVTFVERVSHAVSPLIDEMQELLPNYTYLRSYTFSESSVSIKIDFETLSSISQYIKALENSPYFMDAQLTNVANFELSPATEEVDEEDKFNEVPRYTASITLEINNTYLATGGVQ